MLFKEPWVPDVLAGRKRQSIRTRQPRMKVGNTYAVQTSYYSKSLGRIRVTDIRPCTLATLSEADIEAEGWAVEARDDFERYFAEVNHSDPAAMTAKAWAAFRRRKIWCIDFEPADDQS